MTPELHVRPYAPSWTTRGHRLVGLCAYTPVLGRAFRHNTKWLTYHSKVDPSLVDPSGWYLTLGDCDLDEVWYQR